MSASRDGGDTETVHFVDVETFGLELDRHAIFEIATCGLRRDTPCHTFFLEPDENELANASSQALQLTSYYDRLIKHRPAPSMGAHQMLSSDGLGERFDTDLSHHPTPGQIIWVPRSRREALAEYLAWKWKGHLAGNSVSFDAIRLERWLRRHGAASQWHYHLVDVEVYAAGALGLLPNWSSTDLSEKLGVDVPEDRHTALADITWSRAMFVAAAEKSTSIQTVLGEKQRLQRGN